MKFLKLTYSSPLSPLAELVGSSLLLTLIATALPATAQNSLPLDINLAAESNPHDQTPAVPLIEFGEALDDATPPTAQAEPTPSTPLAPDISPATDDTADPDATPDFPSNLIGHNLNAVIPRLEERGWIVVTRTPGLAQLDRNQLGLDLTFDSGTGEITDATLVQL